MTEFDYIEEAKKIREKRNFGFNFDEDFISHGDEEILSEECNHNLYIYKEEINEILDEIEKRKNEVKDSHSLTLLYNSLLDKEILILDGTVIDFF